MRVAVILFITVFLGLPVSGAMVRGTISDSATGLPISNVKVILAQIQGEREEVVDSAITGVSGNYSFTFSHPVGNDFYLRTIESHYYFQSTPIRTIAIGDTITKDLRLKRFTTKVQRVSCNKSLQIITVRAIRSRLYLSGIKTGAVVDIYNLNGHLLFRAALPSGASEIRMPDGVAVAGSYQVKIRANGGLVRSFSLITGIADL
jgi:hypothetical protein